ncbi:MAG: VPLPA-CTERM sorting domain-containing protein [Jhaorihella sp.]
MFEEGGFTMLEIRKLLKPVMATALALALPVSAGAVTVKVYDTRGPEVELASITDNGAGDLDPTAGSLVASTSSVAGYGLSLQTALVAGYPPLDHLTSTLNLGAGDGSIRIEVSHHFSSAMPSPAQGIGSVTNNFVLFAGSVVSDIYLATSLFGKDSLIASTSGDLTSASAHVTFDPSDYYITQVFTVSGPAASGGTANSEWLAPVPLPAAGLMLLAGLGGMAAFGRRRKKAA